MLLAPFKVFCPNKRNLIIGYIIFPNGIILISEKIVNIIIKGNAVMEISLRPIDTCDIVVIKGRIDSYTAPELSEKLYEITARHRYKIILDMNDVIFVSSAGLRVLIDIQKTCKKMNQGEVVLVNIPSRVYETLELAGFTPLFKFYNDVSSAIAAF
jgi:anti-sigma B factor antagonist